MFEKGVSKARLSRLIKRNGNTVKHIIYRDSIQTYLVWELSVALGHNFFTDLAQQLDAATEGKLQAQQTELEQLKTDYQKLQEDYNLLKKMVDMIVEKWALVEIRFDVYCDSRMLILNE